ncbi:MAG: hypothetical protein ACP5KW_10650 [Thermoproteota archaeon]
MVQLKARDIAIAALLASLWGVLNFTVSPIFFNITRLPILCDMLGVTSLVVAIWLSKKLGVGSLTGAIATVVTLALRPNAFYFLGFFVASVVFDLLSFLIGYNKIFERKSFLLAISTASMGVAGFIIGYVFMNPGNFSFSLYWTALHMVGGAIGGAISVALIEALKTKVKW